jgi:hypothetical protein
MRRSRVSAWLIFISRSFVKKHRRVGVPGGSTAGHRLKVRTAFAMQGRRLRVRATTPVIRLFSGEHRGSLIRAWPRGGSDARRTRDETKAVGVLRAEADFDEIRMRSMRPRKRTD